MPNIPFPPHPPRIGIGTDRHRLVDDRPCVLGGIEIDCPVGPHGHSDGDAILHALCDALLGAAGLDDLGTLFPDIDPKWKGVSSVVLLRNVMKHLADAQLIALSVDIVVCCDRPKLGPHRSAIRAQLSEWLELPIDRVNVKGKTREGYGGKVESVDVTAVVLLSDRC